MLRTYEPGTFNKAKATARPAARIRRGPQYDVEGEVLKDEEADVIAARDMHARRRAAIALITTSSPRPRAAGALSLGARGVWKPLPPALSAGGAGAPDVADLRADDRRVEHGAIEMVACGGVLLHPL